MDATLDARTPASRIKRKPPPAFPYSPRYPCPDPSDPFASLQALRERAHSSQKHGGFTYSTSSLNHTPPMPTADHSRLNSHALPELPPLPRTVVHAARSIDAIDHLRDGYHSDISRPPRPPRARTRPTRDSMSYFSDADVTPSHTPPQHQDQDQEPAEKLPDRQYRYRRRSQTIAIFPATPAPPTAQEPAAQENAAEHQDAHLSNQYVYDDRQSHGHVYGQGSQRERQPHNAPSVESHPHQQLSSLHPVPTPPMTPDDTLTSSSVSVHERFGSLSPETVLEETSLPPPPPKQTASDSDAGHAVPEVTVISSGMVVRNLSRIRTSDFPALLGKTEPDSPAPLPVPPPRPRPPIRADSEPEPDFSTKRRSGLGARRDSITRRFRRSSLYHRDRKISDPSPLIQARMLYLRESLYFEGEPPQPTGTAVQMERAAGSSDARDVPQVVRASGADGHSEVKKKKKISHRKSLSHVSLGILPLPNVSYGPSPSPADNVSVASTLVTYPNSDEYGAPSPGMLPPLPPLPVHAPQPQALHAPAPQPQASQLPQPPQTLAQALELTPLPKKDSPLPPIRKDTRLPTPPREDWGGRASLISPPSEPQRPPVRADEHVEGRSVDNAYARSRQPESLNSSPEQDVVLFRPSRYDGHDYQQASPSPPLSSNPLLSRPTSAFSPIPPQTVVPLISPSPIPPQYPAPNSSFSPIPPRSDLEPRRVPSSIPRRPSPVAPPRRPSPQDLQPRRAPSPASSSPPRRAPSPAPAPHRAPSPPHISRHTPTPPPAPRRIPSPLPHDDEPPTPAPLPLSPPTKMNHDLPTPLPQPPLPPPQRVTVPVYLDELPRGFASPRAPEPVRPQAPPTPPPVFNYPIEAPRTFAPQPEPVRSRTPHESRHQQREQRRGSDDRQERTVTSYNTAPQAGSSVPAESSQPTSSPAPPAVPSRTVKATAGTPYNSVRQHTAARRGAQQPHVAAIAQVQQEHLPFRSETPPPARHISARAQTPEHLPPSAARAQSPQPAPVITARVQSPVPPSRVQAPPPPTSAAPASIATRVAVPPTSVYAPSPPPPPPPSYPHIRTQTRGHLHSQPSSVSHGGDTGTEEYGRMGAMGTNHDNVSESTVASPQPTYAISAESAPLPLPNTPSTTFSHPRRSTDAGLDRRRQNPRQRSVTPPSPPQPTGRPFHTKQPTFNEHAVLTREQIARAAALTVIAQNGLRIPFGELFKERKTIVCFIRHFWCAMGQDYMYSISRNVDVEALKRAGIDFVIIGNGSPGMIKSYRHIFRTPIHIYTDPTLRLYAALGMTLRTTNPGPDSEKGSYIRHGVIGGIAMVVRNALRVGMPVWEKGGDATQLGGEFVLGPGLNCSFAHRMTTTRNHAPILDVLMGAGFHFSIPTAPDGAPSLSPQEEEAWMEERRRSLARMRAKREKRRELGPMPGTGQHTDEARLYEPELGYGHGSESDSGSVSPQGSWASSAEKREVAALVAQRKSERLRERKRGPATTRKVDGGVKERRASKGLGLHVSNPDDHYSHYDHAERDRDHEERNHHRKHHGSTRLHVAHRDVAPEWSGAKPALAYINELGRREDGYETVEEPGTPAYGYRRD